MSMSMTTPPPPPTLLSVSSAMVALLPSLSTLHFTAVWSYSFVFCELALAERQKMKASVYSAVSESNRS